ncbi:transcriptional regulator [Xylanivirga thermophila]|uniref:transcriptional regulator n=1 Tax=Xylanivirga thermophila TaxID=2496273 RepID=UPI00101C6F02|nr:transcriptional regulator [Xylanivirga thermophila]
MKERQLTSFGAIVKKRLIELNKTQRWLADQVGINEKYLHLILYGDRSGETYVDSIMHALDLDPNKILKPA